MRQSVAIDGCPFAQPGSPMSEMGDGFYCRLPGGRVHIPGPDVIRRFCSGDCFTECPVNQRWTAIVGAEATRDKPRW